MRFPIRMQELRIHKLDHAFTSFIFDDLTESFESVLIINKLQTQDDIII